MTSKKAEFLKSMIDLRQAFEAAFAEQDARSVQIAEALGESSDVEWTASTLASDTINDALERLYQANPRCAFVVIKGMVGLKPVPSPLLRGLVNERERASI